MAKQTFTTGQVLTAAQMTSLQQTAMGGGAATAKTASYVLVAADAGTTVAMNAAGATTITVNTGLFAAGDTVFIQNLGAGACTVTAGTATVATAGSLILPQNDAGILYFTATGASIFYDFIQAGAVSPLTTKGDVYTFSTSDTRLAVGANATVLTADSAEATGLKWATPSGGLTLVSRQSFSAVANTSTTFDASFTSTYKSYVICFEEIYSSTNDTFLYFQYRYAGPTTQAGAYYGSVTNYDHNGTTSNTTIAGASQISVCKIGSSGTSTNGNIVTLNVNGVGTSSQKPAITGLSAGNAQTGAFVLGCSQDTARTYTGFILSAAAGNITGTVAIYGLAAA